jgi:DNA helicase II / ATP-dependent DNA helicase PcrA
MPTKTKKSKVKKPSHRQLKIYDTWEKDDKNILIEAVAGSGKTTVLLNLLDLSDGDRLFLAFNKDIKVEIEEHIKQNGIEDAKSMTLHSLGLSAIKAEYPSSILDFSKSYNASIALQKRFPTYFKNKEGFKLRNMLKEMFDVSRLFMVDEKDEIIDYMISMDKYIHKSPHISTLWEEMREMRDDAYNGDAIIIDFIDMIYMPVRFSLKIPYTPKYIFIDEAQDLNLAQHTMIDNFIAQGDIERWVAVGDRKQSIYGFSGAYSTSFDLFKERDNVIELPLDICYRCPQLVVSEANKVYDIMTGFKEYDGKVGVVEDVSEIKKGSMVVCRNSAPLLQLYFEIIAQGKPAFLSGKDIENKIINFITPMKFETIDSIITKTKAKISNLRRMKGPLNEKQAYKLEENIDNLNILLNGGLVSKRVKGEVLITKLKAIFKKVKDGIMLCTIHKSKGLESEVVYLLRKELIPSKWAKSESQLEQEENLRYVATTRASEEFYYLNPTTHETKNVKPK